MVVAILTAVITVHEFGHFIACKAFGVKVDEFSVGWFGPKLVQFRAWDADFSLKVGLIGGYNDIDDESYRQAGGAVRAAILAAGSGFGLLVTFLLALAFYRERLRSWAGLSWWELRWPYTGWWHGVRYGDHDPPKPWDDIHFRQMSWFEIALVLSVAINAFNLGFLPLIDGGKIYAEGVYALADGALAYETAMRLPMYALWVALGAYFISGFVHRQRKRKA